MAVRYTIPFKAYDNEQWRIDILDSSLTSTPVSLRGAGGSICNLNYDVTDADDPFCVLIPSTLSLTLLNQDDIDISELQQAQDMQFRVNLYKASGLKWTGYLKTEGIQRAFKSNPNPFTIEAACGLSFLNDIPYTHNDLMTGGRTPINYFRQILFATANLGLPLPIRWTNTLQCTAFIGEDVFSGGVEWSVDNQGFYSYQASQSDGETGKIKSCGEILEEMLRAFQCRIYQSDGRWNIRRVNDVVSGVFNYKQTPDSLGPLFVNSGSENILRQLGRSGYRFEIEDQIITTKQGVKSAIVEYEANVRENILPNGSQDVVESNGFFDVPIYWGFYEAGTETSAISSNGIDGRSGKSVFIDNQSPTPDVYYTLKTEGGSYGNNGLPIDTKTLVKVISFGFLISIIGGVFVEPDTDIIVWDNQPIKIQIIYNLGATKYYLNEFGFWQATSIEIPIIIQGLKIGEVARVDFDKFQGIIMPTDGVKPAPSDISDITVAFVAKNAVPSNHAVYYLDNIYFQIEQSNDVYESTYTPSKNTSVDERVLKISSSFGGYMVSNLMTSWDKSDEECYYRDGLFYEGTLTGMTANAIMRYRYKSSKVFNGTVNVENGNWSFDQIYLIDTFGTEKYLPLNAKYNVETCAVSLVAMECRNDNIELTEKYYSSNDKQLSN